MLRTKSNSKANQVKHLHRSRRHSLGLVPDPDGGFVPEWELRASAAKVARTIFDPKLAQWRFKVFGDIYDRDGGFVVYDQRSGAEDSWHLRADDAQSRMFALQDEAYELLRADDARYAERGWEFRLLPVDDQGDIDAIDGISLDYDANRPRPDWEAELLADLFALEAAEDFLDGDDERFEIAIDLDWDWRSRELFEAEESARIVRGRSGSTRVSAEEEARMFGWAR